MFDRKRIEQDFSQAARHYDTHALLQRRVLRELLAYAHPFIAADACILDAGCGTGHLARELGRSSVVQLDIAYGMCREASMNGNFTIHADMMSLPFADSVFDVVFSSLVLQWLPDWQAGLAALRRVLKPGGVLAASTLGTGTLQELRASFADEDVYPHVSPFIQPDGSWRKETVTEYLPDLRSIMRALKTIGANNKLSARGKTLMTRGRLERVERFYREHFGHASGLPVTWEVLYRVECL